MRKIISEIILQNVSFFFSGVGRGRRKRDKFTVPTTSAL
jgi:hypothetical protein